MEIAQMWVKISADTSKFVSDLEKTKKQVEDTSKRWADFGKRASDVGKRLATFVTLPLFAAGGAIAPLLRGLIGPLRRGANRPLGRGANRPLAYLTHWQKYTTQNSNSSNPFPCSLS
jgi:hypothetical protein